MPQNMKSVMIFDPKDSDEDTANKFIDFLKNHQSAVQDKVVPTPEQTRLYLRKVMSS